MNINAKQFCDMIISASNNLSNYKEEIDRLNVFPVPDGDTGKNMFLTMSGASAAAKSLHEDSISVCSSKIASATLKSARGNSGVILSQLFRGLSRGFEGKTEVDAQDLANAMKSASDAAYKAVMKPTEGTILTVAREAAVAALEAAQNTDDAAVVLKKTCEGAAVSLDKTPELLPKLKEAGVVDSGGMGWLRILEGMMYALENGKVIEALDASAESAGAVAMQSEGGEDIEFGYCTEFIIEKKDSSVDVNAYRETITPLGDCMIVVEDFDVVKTHIHTNNPGVVLEAALKVGSLINIKIDNMRYQHNEIMENASETPAQPAKPAERKPYAIVAISAGEGFSMIFGELGVTKIVEGGQTMNPSAGDIADAIEAENADVVYILPNNKNIILAAEQSKDLVDSEVYIIPTTTVPQGIAAAIAFDPSADAADNAEEMARQAKSIKTGLVTYAVRDSKFEDVEMKEGDIIGLDDKKIVTAGGDVNGVAVDVCGKICDEDTEVITLYYGKETDEDSARELADRLESEYPDSEVYVQNGGQDVYYYIISAE